MIKDSTNVSNNSDSGQELINLIFNDEDARTILNCFQCGMCTASCPVSEQFPFKTHQMVRIGGLGSNEDIILESTLRYCLTCRTCQEYCPQGVDFIEFVKLARAALVKKGIELEETHDGILTIISELQANKSNGFKFEDIEIPEGYKVSKKGKVAYFFGCLPILDVVFDYLNVNLNKILKDSIKILNKVLDEPPVIIDNIKCCGHDSLWKGHFDTFKKLAEHNVEKIKKAGIQTIITTCAECYRTLKLDYPKYVKGADFEVLHISELISNELKKNKELFNTPTPKKVTFHDSCRLGRHMKLYDQPRTILQNMEKMGVIFNEMERNKEYAPCCGVSCFINCNDFSKALQVDRLTEAKNVADSMILSCPKCQIHYKCILHEKREEKSADIDLEILDLTSLIAKLMGLENQG
ncbi:MAG: (Fe-S)-binding protein [Promethearchaeota archaeon]